MKGKAVVFNIFIGASLSYLGSVIHCPEHYINDMERIKWSFIWNGKPDKINRNTISGPTDKGGIGVVDIRLKLQALKLNVLKKYYIGSGKWKFLFDYCLHNASGNNFLGWYVLDNHNAIVSSSCTQNYYKELILTLKKAGVHYNKVFTCINETKELPLWKNTIITTKTEKKLDSNMLKPLGLNLLKHVMENGNIIYHGTLAKMCNILPINAGRIVSGLKKDINTSYVTEKREGPPNHFLNNLELKNEKGVIERLVDMNVKTVYRSLNNNQYKKTCC